MDFLSNTKFKTVIIIAAIIFVGIFSVGVIMAIVDNNSKKVEDEPATTVEKKMIPNTTTTTKKVEEVNLMLLKVSALIENKKAYDTGSYVKGEIAPGEYAFVKFEGSGSYYEEEDAAGNIIDNENFDSFGYVKVHGKGDIETRGVLISVSAFSELGVSGAKEIYEQLNNKKDYMESGYYKVGADIPAGSYTIESYGSAYFAVMSGPVGNSDIVRNDNFNGKKSVTVRNGQYLEVSRAEITKS